MIVQVTHAKNESHLIKELLPIWSKYCDGFVFFMDTNTDNTVEYLNSVKDKYNILEIIQYNEDETQLKIETNNRQISFDVAMKYSNKILCLDADEYLDGKLSKEELESLLENNPSTTFFLEWIQYTSINTIRTDGPWKYNLKDRIGNFSEGIKFVEKQMHSTHLPIEKNTKLIDKEKLFISHLQWLDKQYVAIKQYHWKVLDYITKNKFNHDTVDSSAYDISVNDFKWEEEYFEYPLKIREDIYEDITNGKNYRIKYIQEKTKEFTIPNLGDWGFNFLNSIPMYFCTASDEKHFPLLINMIGSIFLFNFYDVEEILVYDLGMSESQIRELKNIKKVFVCEIEKTNPMILEDIVTNTNRTVKGSFSWKPVIIKDSLDKFPYVLYLDAGTTIKSPLNNVFKHIIQNNYLLFDCGHSIKQMATTNVIDEFKLNSEKYRWILDSNVFGIDAGFQGISRSVYDTYVLPMYEFSKNIELFNDDSSCPDGFGYGRHDQTLFSIMARKLNMDVQYHDVDGCNLTVDNDKVQFNLTHTQSRVTDKTDVFRSRWNLKYDSYKYHSSAIRRKYNISCITGIGDLNRYGKFIYQFFTNIKQQVNFSRIQFIIIYSEWSPVFDEYIHFDNIVFIKERSHLGALNAWNEGILNCSAEYISNWNIDDLRFPINCKLKYDLLITNDVDLVYNYYVAVTEKELTDEIDIYTKPIQKYPDEFHLHAKSMCMAGPDPMWRKSAHIFFGLFDYKKYPTIGDWEMWIRLSTNGLKFKLIPEILCIYVDHDGTVSNTQSDVSKNEKIFLNQQYNI